MVMTKKKFDCTVSKKFPTGEIASVTFGTMIDKDIPDDPKARDDLFMETVLSTMRDIKEMVRGDKVIRSIWKSVRGAVKSEDKVSKSKDKLKDYE